MRWVARATCASAAWRRIVLRVLCKSENRLLEQEATRHTQFPTERKVKSTRVLLSGTVTEDGCLSPEAGEILS